MKAEIISIGTELLLGEIVDTNSSYLAGQLPLVGLDLNFMSTVGDNHQRIVDTLTRAWQRSDVIMTTGGLGPTQDDVTREAVAALLHEDITIDQNLVRSFEELFRYYKMAMPPSNMKQASVILSAQIIPNPKGTAPGWWIERDNRIIVTMPGPPREMEFMWTREVLPKLRKLTEGTVIISKTLKTFGQSEAKVDEMISSLLSSKNPTIGTYAKMDGVYLRITAKAGTKDEAQELISRMEVEVRQILGDDIWGADDESLGRIVGELLIEKCLTLATIESCTGGLLSNIITNVPGTSRYFKGGIVTYADASMENLGIDVPILAQHNVASLEVAVAMATAVRLKLRTSIGVSITGVTGPQEMGGIPVGTIFIGMDDGQSPQGFVRNFPGNRPQVKQRAVTSALFELRSLLLQEGKCI